MARRTLGASKGKLTVSCPRCDVTWRGTTRDPCWACGQRGIAEVAVAPTIKVLPSPVDPRLTRLP